MDQRLLGNPRPHALRKNDTPALARAIVAVQRGRAIVGRCAVQGTDCILFEDKRTHIKLLVLAQDWLKVVPYLSDGTFDPLVIPTYHWVTVNQDRFDSAVTDIRDQELYSRVLTVLERLFPVEFPTTKI